MLAKVRPGAEPDTGVQSGGNGGDVPTLMSGGATVLPEKATHQQTRTFNQQLVLRALYDQSPLSRADLARLTGLTRTSVGDLVGTLIDDGLIEEVGRGQSSGGKTPILLRVAPDGRQLIGLDLGEAEFSAAVVNLRGKILRSIQLPPTVRDGTATVEAVFRLVDALCADERIAPPRDRHRCAGHHRFEHGNRALVGVPGLGRPSSRTTSRAALRGAGRGGQRQPRSCRRRADLLPAPSAEQPVVIRVGRGVGAGIILNGQLFQGDGYGAGEFGHVWVGGADAPCRCGGAGCLETVTSMRALVEAGSAVERSVTDEGGLVAAFLAGVSGIRRIVLDAARELGLAIGWLIGVLNVRHVLLVGPVTSFGEDWLDMVRSSARASALTMLVGDTQIEFGHVHDDVVVLGASALLMERQLGLGLVR